MTHDARMWCEIGFGYKIERPYGWSCPCGKNGKNFKTGKAAMAAAKKHNGGIYHG